MINAKEFKNIKDLNQIINNKLQNIDGLRFAINPKDLKKKIQIINLLKKKYKKLLFSINIMYLNKWHENVSFLNLVNTLSGNFFSVSFVDSYGSLLPRDIIKLSDKLKNFKCLKGLHLHNNSNLALANSIIGLESGFQIIDTTFSGIGRGAGNAQTELYLSIFEKKKIDINGYMMSNFLNYLNKLKLKYNWGSSFEYSISAQNNIPQSKIMDLINKKRIEPSLAISIMKIEEKKEINLKNYQLINKFKKNKFIIIGGSNNFIKYGEFFVNYLNKRTILVLSSANAVLNYYKLFKEKKITNKVFILMTGSEYNKIINTIAVSELKKLPILLIIAETLFLKDKNQFSKKNDIVSSDSIALNPLLLWGFLVKKVRLKNIYLSFFDGTYQNYKEMLVVNETAESIKKILKMNLNIISHTETLHDVTFENIYSRDD